MGTSILLQCHVVGVDTIGILLILGESWRESGKRLKDIVAKKKTPRKNDWQGMSCFLCAMN